MGNERNQFIDYLKGILIVLVTVGHAFQFGLYQDERVWAHPLFKGIYMFHMPLFMGISGYLSYTGIIKVKFLKFSVNKLKAYLIPIIAWAILYRSFDFLMEADFKLVALPSMIVSEIFSSLWFIWALLGCLLVTVAIHSIGRNFLALYIISFFLVLLLPEYGNIVMFKYMYPYFQVGFLLASRPSLHWSDGARFCLVGGALSVAVLCYLSWDRNSYIYFSGMHLSQGNFWNICIRYLGGFAGSVFAIEALKFLYGKINRKIENGIETLGRDSIYIYILQGYAYIIVARIFTKWMPQIDEGWFHTLLGIILGILVAVACWLGGKILTYNPLMGQILFGKARKLPAPPPSN